MSASLILGAGVLLGIAGMAKYAADVYGESRAASLALLGLGVVCICLGIAGITGAWQIPWPW
jgi:hypothetical protein